MKFKLLHLLIIVTCIVSCNKDEHREPLPHYKICECLYPYLFDLGSYWIYKNETSNITDSIAVENISKDVFTLGPTVPGQGPQGILDFVKIDYSSSNNSEYYSEDLFANEISRGLLKGGFVFLSGKVGDSVLNVKVEEILDTLSVENKIYRNVAIMKIKADNYIHDDCKFYYVDNIGIVKKEIFIGDSMTVTWNLLRCKTFLYNVTDKRNPF